MKTWLAFALVLPLFACEKESRECDATELDRPDQTDCVARALERNGMVAYTGQPVGDCAVFLIHYEHEGESVFRIDANCLNIQQNYQHCAGNAICARREDDPEDCRAAVFCSARERIVVGVQE